MYHLDQVNTASLISHKTLALYPLCMRPRETSDFDVLVKMHILHVTEEGIRGGQMHRDPQRRPDAQRPTELVSGAFQAYQGDKR